MAYTVKIVYAGVPAPTNIPFVSPIASLYVPSNSYVDTPAYAGTVYDTNVEGFGQLNILRNNKLPIPCTAGTVQACSSWY